VLAVISGRLIDAGKLDWNTKFFDVFPELFGGANGVFQDITITDLFKGEALIMPESHFAFAIMMNAGTGSARMPAVDWLTTRILKERFGWWWKFWM
jgi:hypothetical protein